MSDNRDREQRSRQQLIAADPEWNRPSDPVALHEYVEPRPDSRARQDWDQVLEDLAREYAEA